MRIILVALVILAGCCGGSGKNSDRPAYQTPTPVVTFVPRYEIKVMNRSDEVVYTWYVGKCYYGDECTRCYKDPNADYYSHSDYAVCGEGWTVVETPL